MEKLKTKKFRIALIVVIFACASSLYWVMHDNSSKNETFTEATSRCGKQPVIGSADVYYAPGPANEVISYDLMSLYDPANLDLSQFPGHKFYCSIDEAKAAGYNQHKCCGLSNLEV